MRLAVNGFNLSVGAQHHPIRVNEASRNRHFLSPGIYPRIPKMLDWSGNRSLNASRARWRPKLWIGW
jgi:hypothetical protein